jgi:hypothetical protein
MKRRKVKLLTVFFVAIAIQITNCCREIFSNFGLLLVLTVRKAETGWAALHPPRLPLSLFWELFDGKLQLNPRHAKCLGSFCAAGVIFASRFPQQQLVGSSQCS